MRFLAFLMPLFVMSNVVFADTSDYSASVIMKRITHYSVNYKMNVAPYIEVTGTFDKKSSLFALNGAKYLVLGVDRDGVGLKLPIGCQTTVLTAIQNKIPLRVNGYPEPDPSNIVGEMVFKLNFWGQEMNCGFSVNN